MDRKTLLRDIAYKLIEVRKPFKCSHREMADRLGAVRSSYSRYEKAETAPQITTLYKLGKNYNVSLDWLILNKGPMYYNEKEIEIEKKNQKPKPKPDAETLQTITEEYDELKTLMERIPLLRYEVMSLLYKFKEDRLELVEAARLD